MPQPVAVPEPAPGADRVQARAPVLEAPAVLAHSEEASPPRNAPPLPRIALELPADSGLVLVETTRPASQAVDEAEPARPRRVRPPRVVVADESLQMVETTRKDSTPPAAE